MEFYAERFRTIFREAGDNLATLGSQVGGMAGRWPTGCASAAGRGGAGSSEAGEGGAGSGGSGSGGSGSGGAGGSSEGSPGSPDGGLDDEA